MDPPAMARLPECFGRSAMVIITVVDGGPVA
jgi:hypothetical protein